MLNLTGTGNTVANYREDEIPCPECEGTGYKRFYSLREMLDYLTKAWPLPSRMRFFDLLHFAREFKKEGSIQCQTCEGEGTVEVIE